MKEPTTVTELITRLKQTNNQQEITQIYQELQAQNNKNVEILKIKGQSLILSDVKYLSSAELKVLCTAEPQKIAEACVDNYSTTQKLFKLYELKIGFTHEELATRHPGNQRTILHLAAYGGHTDIVNMILSHKEMVAGERVDVSKTMIDHLLKMQDSYGQTPLHLAYEKGKTQVINTILEYEGGKESSKIKDKGGKTPSQLPALEENVETVNIRVVVHSSTPPKLANSHPNSNITPGKTYIDSAKTALSTAMASFKTAINELKKPFITFKNKLKIKGSEHVNPLDKAEQGRNK